MPTEASRESPKREPKVSSADCSSPAAIIARRAWSSYRIGTLKRAITASPMYLSIKAPCLTNTSVAIRKKASMTSCVLSAPRSWVSSVNDDRSAKSTVISNLGLQFTGRDNSASCMVLIPNRDVEKSHHGVANVFVDKGAVFDQHVGGHP